MEGATRKDWDATGVMNGVSARRGTFGTERGAIHSPDDAEVLLGPIQRSVFLRLYLAEQDRGLDVFAVQHEGVVVLGRCGVGRGVDLEVSGELGHVLGRAGNGRRGRLFRRIATKRSELFPSVSSKYRTKLRYLSRGDDAIPATRGRRPGFIWCFIFFFVVHLPGGYRTVQCKKS